MTENFCWGPHRPENNAAFTTQPLGRWREEEQNRQLGPSSRAGSKLDGHQSRTGGSSIEREAGYGKKHDSRLLPLAEKIMIEKSWKAVSE